MTGTQQANFEHGRPVDPLADNSRLRDAVHRFSGLSRKGLEERLFTFAFSGLVYPQIWEDPVIDMEAMALQPGQHVVAIASGGCNILNYVASADVRVTGLDLNPAHVAFNNLKHTAVRNIQDYETFAQFFADADNVDNLRVYEEELAPKLDAVSRAYWEGRDRIGRKRVGYFIRNIYKHGLLGQFIATGHIIAKMHGKDPRKILAAKTREEQVAIFESEIAPLFDRAHIRWITDRPASLFGLGIPPSQFDALKGDEQRMATVLLARTRRLACGFDLKDNYFAWQAFGRGYFRAKGGPLPLYLQEANWQNLKARSNNFSIVHASFTEHLAMLPQNTYDAYVLLDAQDWMTDEQLTALWTQIVRTARPGARVIFRTAGEETILPGRVPDAILKRFTYDRERCREMTERDRSSIYGGFHLYTLGA